MTVASTSTYVADLRQRFPGADLALVDRLAAMYRLIDFHTERLETDPGDKHSSEQIQKLSALALRHEEAIDTRKATTPHTPPRSARRQ